MVLPSSRNIGASSRGIGDKDVLQRRVYTSHKYDRVKSSLDTGLTLSKALKRSENSRAGRALRGEHFKRLKPLTFARMLAEEAVEYLVLDVRETDEYEAGHARGSISYPATLFTHSCHPFSAEVLRYKNREGAAIILVDNDERVAGPAANLCFEKGVDNIYVLSGGLRALQVDAPSAFLGDLPSRPGTAMSTASGASRKYYGGSGGGARGGDASLRQLPSYNSVRPYSPYMGGGGPGHYRAFRI